LSYPDRFVAYTMYNKVMKSLWEKIILTCGGVVRVSALTFHEHSLRCVVFKVSRKSIELENYGWLPLPIETMTDGEVADEKLLVKKISDLTKKLKVKRAHVGLSARRAHVATTYISDSVQTAPQYIIEEHISNELKLRGLDVAQWTIEYEILARTNFGYHVWYSAVPKKVVVDMARFCTQAGCKPLRITIAKFSLSPFLRDAKTGGIEMYVDLGYHATHIALAHSAVISHSYVKTGVQDLHKSVSDSLNISRDQARIIIDRFGITRSHKEERVRLDLLSRLDTIIREASSMKIRFETQDVPNEIGRLPVTGLVLYGQGAEILGIAEHLSRELHIPVRYANIWQHVYSFKDSIPQMTRNESLFFAPALALALEALGVTGMKE